MFKVLYSKLDTAALNSELISRYDLKITDCALFRSGMNDVYIVNAEQDVYYLRIALTGKYELIDYVEETTIMIRLNGGGVKTATPVQCRDGSFVWSVEAPEGIRYAVLFSAAKNQPLEDDLIKSFNLGQSVAKMHLIADEKNFKVSRAPIDFIQLIQHPLEQLKPYLEKQNPAEYEFIYTSMENLREFIAARLTTKKPYYGFCHGDIQASNVFFDGYNPTFFDFDTMGYGWRSHDISVYIWNEALVNNNYLESNNLKNFLEGYNSIRQLSENEIDCINAFGAIRALWALCININLAQSKHGSYLINYYINLFIGIFKTWYNKVFPNQE